MPWFWNILSYNIPSESWKAAINSIVNIIGSCHAITSTENIKTYQQIFSNGFEITTADNNIITNNNVQNNTQNNNTQNTKEKIPLFEKNVLLNMTNIELKEICTKYNISHGKNKAALVNNILMRSNTMNEKEEEYISLQKEIKNTWLLNPAPLHDFYCSQFNLIDLIDKRWNSVEEHHPNHAWKSKMITTILRFAVINCWTYSTKYKFTKWKAWRKELAKELMNYDL